MLFRPLPPYMIWYPRSRYITQAIEYSATFLVRISAVFFARTRPDSSMAKPAAIHITSTPLTRK